MTRPSHTSDSRQSSIQEITGSRRRSLRFLMISGCLAMIYAVGIGSPVTTEFFRAIGANEFHFGLITGIPLVMLLMQFAGAAVLNRAHRRKTVFIVGLVICRLLYLGVAFLPFVLRGAGRPLVVTLVIILLALSAAAHNFAVPFWFSWMADLIPKRIINRVWGWRQMAMHVTWTAAFLLITLYLYLFNQPATVVFPALILIAVVAGVSDVLLFLGVTEPPNLITRDNRPLQDFLAPLRDPVYRRFVIFSCAWSFSTMFAASFMQLYVLKVIGLEPWKASLIWCVQGIGMAIASGMWGRLADRYGSRPVLKTCVTLKPMIVIVFLLLTPGNVIWLLPLAFLPDGMLNAGNALASNGYMLSIAPRQNRSMFIAAITGLAGVCGGVSSMLAGAFLTGFQDWHPVFLGREWNTFHAVFATSLLLRLACQPLVRRIQEPGARHSRQMLGAMMDEWPLSIVRFPVGLFRRTR
jgi:MFS family permease